MVVHPFLFMNVFIHIDIVDFNSKYFPSIFRTFFWKIFICFLVLRLIFGILLGCSCPLLESYNWLDMSSMECRMHAFLLSLILFGLVLLGNLFFPLTIVFYDNLLPFFFKIAYDKTFSTSRDFNCLSFYLDVDFSKL